MNKKAKLYRSVTKNHICPYGLKSKDLLESNNFEIEDILLKNQKEIDLFKAEYSVKTTPQTFIGNKKIGGYEDLSKYLNVKLKNQDKESYQPIVFVFLTALFMSLALSLNSFIKLSHFEIFQIFIANSLCILGILKLIDLESFSNQFITYDLLAQKKIKYSYLYPFIETASGILMLSQKLPILTSLMMFFIGSIGAISILKAVYIDKRELRCACVGGNSKVPLGFISLTENLIMVFMAIAILI